MTDISNQEQKQIIEAKNLLASKQDVMREIGQIQAFEFVNQLATVATLKLINKVKESKEYIGLTYRNEKGELATVANWEEFCTFQLNTPKRTVDDRLLNLNTFGEAFYESSQNLGLGSRELRKLRQLPSDEQALIIDSEAVNLEDKEAVKDLIEDLTEQHNKEKSKLESDLTEANQVAKARKKVADASNATCEELHKKIEQLEDNQKSPQNNWSKVVQEINLQSTTLAATIIESLDKLLELNERISTEQIEGDHSEIAFEQLAQVQVHCVDQAFIHLNGLHIETRERFERFVNGSHAMYSEDELIALEQEVITKG